MRGIDNDTAAFPVTAIRPPSAGAREEEVAVVAATAPAWQRHGEWNDPIARSNRHYQR